MNKNVVVVCVTAIVITIVGIGGWVVAMGYDTDRALGWIGTNVGPVLLILVNILMTKRVKDDTQTVKVRTNGVLDQLFTRLRRLEGQGGPTPPVPGTAPTVTHARPEEGPPAGRAPG